MKIFAWLTKLFSTNGHTPVGIQDMKKQSKKVQKQLDTISTHFEGLDAEDIWNELTDEHSCTDVGEK